jgi:CBS domain-containing membrane protein
MNVEDNKMITIEEFMTSEPYTLRKTDSINDAWEVMIRKHIRHIPITDDDNHVLGLITQRDVLAATEPGAIRNAKSASHEVKSDITLAEIMIRDVKVIHKEDSLRQAALYLQSHKFGCLPVISGGGLVGIITDSDFIDIAINLLEQAEIAEDDGFAIDDESDQELADTDLPETDEVM